MTPLDRNGDFCALPTFLLNQTHQQCKLVISLLHQQLKPLDFLGSSRVASDLASPFLRDYLTTVVYNRLIGKHRPTSLLQQSLEVIKTLIDLEPIVEDDRSGRVLTADIIIDHLATVLYLIFIQLFLELA